MHISRAFSHYENPIKVINYYKSSGLLQSTQYFVAHQCGAKKRDTLIHMIHWYTCTLTPQITYR